MVLAPRDFRDEEYEEPRELLENNGYDIEVASTQKGVAKGVQGSEAQIDMTTDEVNPNEYRAIIFIGGPGMSRISEDPVLLSLARKFYKKNRLVAAICIAPAVLANAGILENKKATSFPDGREALISGGADFVEKEVVMDERIITANGPQASQEFAQSILDHLG